MESESEESERIYFFQFHLQLSHLQLYDPVKTRLSESEAETEEPTNHKAQKRHCVWFILPLLLPTTTI